MIADRQVWRLRLWFVKGVVHCHRQVARIAERKVVWSDDEMTTEATIRDHLAANLVILEPGLSLVKTEFVVRAPEGNRGSIDILARDPFGHFIIIEVKRSNQTAREALHELIKYTNLLPFNIKSPDYRIRCILVSTEWRELRRPFSTFKREFSFGLDGYHLVVDDRGRPVSATKVEPLAPLSPAPDLHGRHSMLFFTSRERRAAAEAPVAKALEENGLADAFVMTMSLATRDETVIYPFALYIAFYEVPEPKDQEEARARAAELAENVEESPDFFATNTGDLWADRALQAVGHLCDDCEGSRPTRLGGILCDWRVEAIARLGDAPSAELVPDEMIVEMIAGLDTGENRRGLRRYVTPRYGKAWKVALRQMRLILGDDRKWRIGADVFLRTVEREMPSAAVWIAVHVVDNLLLSMQESALGRVEALPGIEIVAQDGKEARALYGLLLWDALTWPTHPEPLLSKLEESPELASLNAAFPGEIFRPFNDEILAAHGLQRGLIECHSRSGEVKTFITDVDDRDQVTRKEGEVGRQHLAWMDAHPRYWAELNACLSRRVLGL